MNKKFSTLLAGALLATSVGAVNVVGSFPAQTPVGNGTEMKSGDKMVLSPDLFYPKKDSLALGDAPVANASKGMIDSLIFTVQRKAGSELWGGNAVAYEEFVFTSKAGKFAFNKPSGVVAAAMLNVNGSLNTCRIAKAVTDTEQNAEMYAPYIVATRKKDGTPKSVYVLASLQKDMDANKETGEIDAKEGSLQILQVEWNDCLKSGFSEKYQKLIVFPADKEYAEFCEADNKNGKGADNATHKIFRIKGNIITDASVPVTSSTIKDLLGYEKPSFDFSDAELNVSKGEENLLAAYNYEYTSDGYLKAIGAKQAKTDRQLFLTVDTFFYDNQNGRNLKLSLDTLPSVGDASKWVRTVDTYKFDINAVYGSDSISVIAKAVPDYKNNSWTKKGKIQFNTGDAVLVVKKFGAKAVLTTKDASDTGVKAPFIVTSEFPTKTLEDETVAQFTSGDVYVIYDMNKMNGTQKNEYYGLPLVIDNMQSRFTQKFVNTNKFDQTLPSHQWVALKSDNINVYTFANRETGATADAPRKAAMGDIQLYVVDADENLYTYGSKADTIKMVKIDSKTLSPFDGYRVITKEEQMNKVFSLRFISELLGDEAYVEQNADSAMTVAVGNKDNAAEVRFFAMSTLYSSNDTIKIGVEDHELTVVPYTVKIGRYFLAYDSDKKVYRFTNKQYNEANAEEGQPYYDDRFVITKLAGGNVALVPFTTLYGSNQVKLAIDSENGNAVRVALDSDLRHAFELTEPANRIFAEVLGNTDTTLVKVNFNSVENLGWKIAKGDDDFLYEGVAAELKAGGAEYESKAFDFKLDTAYVNRPGNTMPLYYITYDAVRGDSVPVSHIHDNGAGHVCPAPLVNDTVSGKFLFMMNDSLNISRANDLKYGYTYNYETYAKLQMIDAKHINDTLIVNRVNPVEADTLKAGDIDEDATVEQMQYQWLNYDNKALFAFRVNMDNKEEYAIYNPATRLYITYLNGFVVATSNAAFYTLKDENGFNVSNENIETSASSIKVMATKGAIQIVGAQGKKVVVSNILGQTVANTVITSDNATIAAPAGVVVVAVEGEEAVKAIVK